MAAPILKISKDPVTLTIRKAKVVEGNFGPQLWCAVADAQGEEHTLYLPWATKHKETGEFVWSGVAQQFVKTGVIGPEDWNPEPGTWVEGLQDHTFTFDRVFKDGSQFINVKLASGSAPARTPTPAPLVNAAVQQLDLARAEDETAFTQALKAPVQPPRATSKPKESADARIARAFQHVMETYAPQLAELDPTLARAIVALTATFAIAYEKE